MQISHFIIELLWSVDIVMYDTGNNADYRPSGWVGDIERIVIQGDACIVGLWLIQESDFVDAIQWSHFHRRRIYRCPVYQLLCIHVQKSTMSCQFDAKQQHILIYVYIVTFFVDLPCGVLCKKCTVKRQRYVDLELKYLLFYAAWKHKNHDKTCSESSFFISVSNLLQIFM